MKFSRDPDDVILRNKYSLPDVAQDDESDRAVVFNGKKEMEGPLQEKGGSRKASWCNVGACAIRLWVRTGRRWELPCGEIKEAIEKAS